MIKIEASDAEVSRLLLFNMETQTLETLDPTFPIMQLSSVVLCSVNTHIFQTCQTDLFVIVPLSISAFFS